MILEDRKIPRIHDRLKMSLAIKWFLKEYGNLRSAFIAAYGFRIFRILQGAKKKPGLLKSYCFAVYKFLPFELLIFPLSFI